MQCSMCGTDIPPKRKSCPACRARLPAAQPLANVGAIGAKRSAQAKAAPADQSARTAGQRQKSAASRVTLAELAAEVAHLRQEKAEARAYQAAVSDVLGIISRSPNQLQPVLDAIAERAARLCEATDAIGLLRVGDRLEHRAHFGPILLDVEGLPLTHGTLSARAVIDRKTLHVHNLQAEREEYPEGCEIATRVGYHTVLAVPLLRAGEAVGSLVLRRMEIKPFTSEQIALLQTFADQAVIAIENARLFEAEQTRTREVEAKSAELAQSLEYQTAISAVLNVIARSPGQLQPVLDTIVTTGARLCDAEFSTLFRVSGQQCILIATNNIGSAFAKYLIEKPPTLITGSPSGRAALEGRTIHIPDLLKWSDNTRRDAQTIGQQRAILSVPLMRGGAAVGVMSLMRSRPHPFTDWQIELVETFADQAVIAIENARLLDELQTRQREVEARSRELAHSLEFQTATSEVLEVISRSPSQIQPVLDSLSATAARLCHADYAVFFRLHEGKYHVGSSNVLDSAFVQMLAGTPLSPGRTTCVGRTALEGRVIHIEDSLADPELTSSPINLERQRVSGLRTVLGVPVMRNGQAIAVIFLARTAVQPFELRQIDLVKTLGEQALIAIENARLFEEVQARTKELTESLEYQTAISEVLGVISRSPTDLQPVFDTIAANATRLCGAKWSAVNQFDNGTISLTALHNVSDATGIDAIRQLFPRPVATSGGAVDQAILSRDVAYIRRLDESSGFPYFKEAAASGAGCIVAVPMLRAGEPIGTISVTAAMPNALSDRQIGLLKAFANQAVIAINNVGLFEEVQARTKELTETLERETSTSDILRVIAASPTDIKPVLQAVVDSANQLCAAQGATILLKDGAWLVLGAQHGAFPPNKVDKLPIERGTIAGRSILDRAPIHVHDLAAAGEEYPRGHAMAKRLGHRTTLAIPLLREGEAIGCLFLRRTTVRPFTDKQIALLQTFADQAVIAIENTRLFEEVQARTKELARSVEELKSLGEVGRTVSSTLDMGTVLQTVLENAARMAFASGGTIYVYDAASQQFHLEAGYNMSEEHIARVKAQPIRMGEPVVGECAAKRAAVQIEDLSLADRSRTPLLDILMRAGVRSILAVPLLHQGEVIGALVVRRNSPGRFAPETVRLLEAFAAQSAIAVNNARLFKEVESKGRELEIASQHKSQFVANMSHELRTPLAAMLGYAELMREGLFGALPDEAMGTVSRIQANGKHLLGLINAVLDISKIEAGQFELNLTEYSIRSLVETVRVATESLAQEKNLALTTEVPSSLPRGYGDEQRLAQVLLNLIGNAIKFTEHGGVRIAVQAEDGHFQVAVSDTGPGIPASELERIFEEFHQVDGTSTKAKGGTGLGLTIARRIVELHGGAIRVESTIGKGSTFRLKLPVKTVIS